MRTSRQSGPAARRMPRRGAPTPPSSPDVHLDCELRAVGQDGTRTDTVLHTSVRVRCGPYPAHAVRRLPQAARPSPAAPSAPYSGKHSRPGGQADRNDRVSRALAYQARPPPPLPFPQGGVPAAGCPHPALPRTQGPRPTPLGGRPVDCPARDGDRGHTSPLPSPPRPLRAVVFRPRRARGPGCGKRLLRRGAGRGGGAVLAGGRPAGCGRWAGALCGGACCGLRFQCGSSGSTPILRQVLPTSWQGFAMLELLP